MNEIRSLEDYRKIHDLEKQKLSLCMEVVNLNKRIEELNKINLQLINENKNLRQYADLFLERLSNGLKL